MAHFFAFSPSSVAGGWLRGSACAISRVLLAENYKTLHLANGSEGWARAGAGLHHPSAGVRCASWDILMIFLGVSTEVPAEAARLLLINYQALELLQGNIRS